MTIACFTIHVDYIQEWDGGIRICLLCAAKHELALTAKTALLKIKMLESVHG